MRGRLCPNVPASQWSLAVGTQTCSCHQPFQRPRNISLWGGGLEVALAGTLPSSCMATREWGADLAIVGASVDGVIEVQWGLPAEPPAVQTHVLVHHHTVEVFVGPQGPNHLTCMKSPGQHCPQPALLPQHRRCLLVSRKQPGLTFSFNEEEGKLLYFLGVCDAHLPAHLL